MSSRYNTGNACEFSRPDITLYCEGECDGKRTFAGSSLCGTYTFPNADEIVYDTLRYTCRNCQSQQCDITVGAAFIEGQWNVIKIGQLPAFGPPIPSTVVSLLGPDRQLFLSGRQCLNHGQGIGAFAYFRRIVENQRTRIIDRVIEAFRKANGDSEQIVRLEKAKNETQFTKSLEMARDALPDVLYIDGTNPLALLHRALSEGIHALDDDECLTRADAIRIVLQELAQRIDQLRAEHRGLREAINRLNAPSGGSNAASK